MCTRHISISQNLFNMFKCIQYIDVNLNVGCHKTFLKVQQGSQVLVSRWYVKNIRMCFVLCCCNLLFMYCFLFHILYIYIYVHIYIYIYIYIMLILHLWDLSTLCVVDHLWPFIYIYKYIYIYILFVAFFVCYCINCIYLLFSIIFYYVYSLIVHLFIFVSSILFYCLNNLVSQYFYFLFIMFIFHIFVYFAAAALSKLFGYLLN